MTIRIGEWRKENWKCPARHAFPTTKNTVRCPHAEPGRIDGWKETLSTRDRYRDVIGALAKIAHLLAQELTSLDSG
ncbi:hypothetical protein [Paraburkholderia flava]|uniref:hypothetical protein n=1 Tax=Paraburkholderia flava TaxID=2547393 RepID=UPI001060A4B3|nr:hypothetical protein [Paraburkholderia flava]